jgi:hypothetical protein
VNSHHPNCPEYDERDFREDDIFDEEERQGAESVRADMVAHRLADVRQLGLSDRDTGGDNDG